MSVITEFIVSHTDFFSAHNLQEFSGDCRFLRNYKTAFPENPFGLFWVEPFNYEWKDYGACWVAPVRWFTGDTVGFYCREILGKEKILVAKHGISLWYGMEMLKYMDTSKPLFITEGPKDRISCSRYYPWTISLLGTGLGTSRAEVLFSLVKRVVFLLDRDSTGIKRASILHKQILEMGIKSEIMYTPSSKSDPGDYLETKFIESSRFAPIFSAFV